MDDPLLRHGDVARKLGVASATLHRMRAKGDFPAPLQLSEGVIRWRESAVDKWINSRPKAAIKASAPQGGS